MNGHLPLYPPFTGTHKIKFGDSPSVDAFGRARVSDPYTIFDSKQLGDKQPLFWDDQAVSGSGTGSTYSANTSSTVLSVALNTAGRRVRQTFMRFNYQPGKSQYVKMTFTLDKLGGGTGIDRYVGLMDDNNGIFLHDNAGTVKLGIRSYTGGSASNTEVAQSAWNIDRMNGSGPSGLTLDWTKSQIMVFDVEWLGVGTVTVGFVYNRNIYWVHQFHNANLAAGVYMTTPNLPLRYEIVNDGTGAQSQLECICCSVESEGGFNPIGVSHSHGNGATTVTLASAGTYYALLGIKLKAAYLDRTIIPTLVSASGSSNSDVFEVQLRMNPTVAGTFTYADKTNSAVQVATGVATNTVTNGTILWTAYASTQAANEIPVDLMPRIGASIAGTADTLVVCANPVTANPAAVAALNWREV